MSILSEAELLLTTNLKSRNYISSAKVINWINFALLPCLYWSQIFLQYVYSWYYAKALYD